MHAFAVCFCFLRNYQAPEAFVTRNCGGRRIRSRVADKNRRKKRLIAGQYIKHEILEFAGLRMNRTGDFHER